MGSLQAKSRHGPGDRVLTEQASASYDLMAPVTHALDRDEARKVHRQLLSWFYLERERQAVNRMEMAMDHDFYDGIQWDETDAADLRDRGQMPLVFNEVAPMCDWMIGTERRSRVDWKVLPRTEDDVQAADIKTKTLKYVSDVNRVPFVRSRAFADCIKGGVGWLDDGARDDPTKDVLYSQYEDWRRVLWDSAGSYDPDLEDGRYLFRWRWVDEDVALMMIPDRRAQLLAAMDDGVLGHDSGWEEEEWQTTRTMSGTGTNVRQSGFLYASSGQQIDAKRRRVRIIEAQFRMPIRTKVIAAGPLKGAVLHPDDQLLHQALGQVGGTVVDKVMMVMHVALFTEKDMLALGRSGYRHNRFTLTPIWCYRRSRDRMPYGAIRRQRDVQMDLNKRASKAQWLLNTNRIIMDQDAVEDEDEARDEADRPDGTIVKKPGKEFKIDRDMEGANAQLQLMEMHRLSIQRSGSVTDENMGRKTNAVSGEAIKARQLQGSVATTEPFDNLRLAVQVQGEKQLSLVEQFYSEEKVIRLTGARGAIDWVKINTPEVQPDGSVRYLNDITASMADFVVSEQDYAGSMRQVMFDSLSAMCAKLAPEVALRLLTTAMEFSDLPNKDEIADQIRRITGDRDPNKEMTPEEMQQAEQQLAQQAEAMQLQRETAIAVLDEQRAKVREINAKAAKLESEADGAGQTGLPPEVERAMRQIQEEAAGEIDRLSRELAKAQSDAANKTMAINKDADTKIELGRINAASAERVAEIQQAGDKKIDAILAKFDKLVDKVSEVGQQAAEAGRAVEKIDKTVTKVQADAAAAPAPEKPAAAPAPAPAAPAQPINIEVNVDAKQGPVTKKLVVERKDGKLVTATVDVQPKGDAPEPKKKGKS